jgi:hypothetical protein
MSTYKNISGNYTITVNNGTGNVDVLGYLNVSKDVAVVGNLSVAGNITYVEELAVDDDFIIVAANNSPSSNVTSMGMLATNPTSPATYAGLRFNADPGVLKWQISPSVTVDGVAIVSYANIASGDGGVPGGNVADIQINNGAGGFTANGSFQYDIANTKLTLNGHQVLSNIGSAPTAVANSVAIYNNAPGEGATGLYTVGTTTAAD